MSGMSELRDALERRLSHDLNALDRGDLHQDAINDIIAEVYQTMGVDSTVGSAVGRDVLYKVIGFGPLLKLMLDDTVTEIMVNGPFKVFVEQNGRTVQTDVTFESLRHLRYVMRRLLHLSPGKRLDETSPMVDLSLPDGSRVNVVIPPAAVGGPQISIRKYVRRYGSLESLVENGTMSAPMAVFLAAAMQARQTVLLSGASGSGKTTLAEILGHNIQYEDRLVVIEDTYELKFDQPNQVRLLTREPNVEGTGGVSIRDLFRNCLRMRPDRVILGEVRGEEAFDFLQAATSGHRGSIGIIHASNPIEALVRLQNLASQSGLPIPTDVLQQQVAHGVDLVVQIDKDADGARRVHAITEVRDVKDGRIEAADLFVYRAEGIQDGRIVGRFAPTGEVPAMLPQLRLAGANIDEALFKD